MCYETGVPKTDIFYQVNCGSNDLVYLKRNFHYIVHLNNVTRTLHSAKTYLFFRLRHFIWDRFRVGFCRIWNLIFDNRLPKYRERIVVFQFFTFRSTFLQQKISNKWKNTACHVRMKHIIDGHMQLLHNVLILRFCSHSSMYTIWNASGEGILKIIKFYTHSLKIITCKNVNIIMNVRTL